MEHLKNDCLLSNPTLQENLRIECDIHLKGKVLELWSASPYGGKIKAQVYFYGDDGTKGDTLLHHFEYGPKISNPGSDELEEKLIIAYRNSTGNRNILDEDKNGRDEIYAVFFLTMTFENVEGLKVDAVISDLARTNTLKKNF